MAHNIPLGVSVAVERLIMNLVDGHPGVVEYRFHHAPNMITLVLFKTHGPTHYFDFAALEREIRRAVPSSVPVQVGRADYYQHTCFTATMKQPTPRERERAELRAALRELRGEHGARGSHRDHTVEGHEGEA
jgi:hypothetical protein